MKRYKVGVIGSDSLIGINLLKTLLKRNFPYSLIRALTFDNDKKEIKVDDYIFSLTLLNKEALLDLDVVFVIDNDYDINEYLDFLKENNKYVVIISSSLKYNEYKYLDINQKNNIFLVNDPNALVIKTVLGNIDFSLLDVISFHSVIENKEQEINNLKQQYLDYFNYQPLTASNLNYIDNKRIPLAFNLIPYSHNSDYNDLFKDEVYHLLNKDFIFNLCDFYIPSFCCNAMRIKIEGINNQNEIEKINNLENIKIYSTSPSLIECEGNENIHLGNIKTYENGACFFISFDYLKVLCLEAVKIMEKRISYD